jgi:hypothetical protein
MGRLTAVMLLPVLLWAPPIGDIVEITGLEGVENVKFADVAEPAESADITA